MKHFWIAFGLALALAAWPAAGQSIFASMTGQVTDPAGAAIPKASVEATQIETGYKYTTESNESGQYNLGNLREGSYKLRVSMAGFADFTAQGIVLAGRDARRVDVVLQVGSVATSVEVTAGATLIETESARVSDTKTFEEMRAMPLSLRRLSDMYQLSPQVSKPRGAFHVRFAGSRSKQGDISVDGTSISSTFGGPSTGVTSDRTESFQEMRTDVAGNSAEFQGIGQISIVTRSGTNELHGQAFHYYTTPGLVARNPFSPVNTASIEHVPGGLIGGPVYIPKIYDGRNKTFFFSSIEFERFGPPGIQTMTPTVPIGPWRRGDFSGLLPRTVVRDPFNNNTPFPNNIIPTNRLNPVSVKLQDRFYPLPNFGDPNVLTAQNYRQNVETPKLTNPTWVMRLDHRFSDRAFVYGRITKTDWNQWNWNGGMPTLGYNLTNRRSRSASVSYTQTITSTLLNEARWGFASDNIPSSGPINGSALAQDLGLRGLAGDIPANAAGTFNFGFAGLGITGINGGVDCDPCAFTKKDHFQNHLSWFRGSHTVKGGFYAAYGRYQDLRQAGGLFGNNTFSDRFTGHPYADFLLGIPSNASRSFPALAQNTNNWSWALFAQDDWKVRPWLTVSYGMRYEVKYGFRGRDGLISGFDIGRGKIVIPDGALGRVSPLMPRGYVDVVEASAVGFNPKTLINTDWNNFAPRIGFAARFNQNRTVFRGGYGFFYDIVARNPALSTVPFNVAEPQFVNPAGNPQIILPTVFPGSSGAPTTVAIPGALNPNIRIPYSMQYTATLEHQQFGMGWRVSYTGTNTRQGVYSYNYNQPVADNRPFVDKTRAFPQYPNIIYTTNGAGHQYHGLTAEFERPLTNGLRIQGYATWARDIGDLEDGEQPEDAYNRERERGVWQDIPTFRWSSNVIYELPFGKGKTFLTGGGRIANSLVSGWRVSTIHIYDSGFFLTPFWTGPDPTGTRFTTSRTPPIVTIRPDHLRDANLDERTVRRWFDVGAFGAPQPGRFGTAAKGVIKGPPTHVMHATVAKFWNIGERFRVRTEVIATNATNHPNYMDPDTNVSNLATAGTINNVVNRNTKFDSGIPRLLQFHLRVEF